MARYGESFFKAVLIEHDHPLVLEKLTLLLWAGISIDTVVEWRVANSTKISHKLASKLSGAKRNLYMAT